MVKNPSEKILAELYKNRFNRDLQELPKKLRENSIYVNCIEGLKNNGYILYGGDLSMCRILEKGILYYREILNYRERKRNRMQYLILTISMITIAMLNIVAEFWDKIVN